MNIREEMLLFLGFEIEFEDRTFERTADNKLIIAGYFNCIKYIYRGKYSAYTAKQLIPGVVKVSTVSFETRSVILTVLSFPQVAKSLLSLDIATDQILAVNKLIKHKQKG